MTDDEMMMLMSLAAEHFKGLRDDVAFCLMAWSPSGQSFLVSNITDHEMRRKAVNDLNNSEPDAQWKTHQDN